MVFDKTGSLANMKRHDYLPFGEEISAFGGRTSAQGYTPDGIRQQFTQKERDNETGLDYFLARYYSATQGRFTSPDEFKGGPIELFEAAAGNPTFYADLSDPQSLNKYNYAYNNPLSFVDPDGHQGKETVKQILNAGGQVLKDTAIGGSKGAANVFIESSNTVNSIVDAGLSPFTDFRFGKTETFKASTPGEQSAMTGVNIVALYSGARAILKGAGTATGLISDLAGAEKIESSTAAAARLGREGEALSGIVKNKERIPSLTGTANFRIPDGLNFAAKTIEESKNVAKLGLTNQIRDDIRFAQKHQFTFTLHVRTTTILTKPLQREVAAGNVRINTFRF